MKVHYIHLYIMYAVISLINKQQKLQILIYIHISTYVHWCLQGHLSKFFVFNSISINDHWQKH